MSEADKAATAAENLRQETAALAVTLQSIDKRLQSAISRDEVEEQFLTKQQSREVRRRIVVSVVIGMLVTVLTMLGLNNYAIGRCFFNGERGLDPSDRLCNTLFTGYDDVAEQQNETLKEFGELVSQIPVNKANIEELERRIAELEGR